MPPHRLPAGAANGLRDLSQVTLRQGDCQSAIGYGREALGLSQRATDRLGEILALSGLAEALHQAGQSAAARTELQIALRLAAETGNTHQQADIHRNLADNYKSTGHADEAERHWQQALDLYAQLDAPEADEVRARLNGTAEATARPTRQA